MSNCCIEKELKCSFTWLYLETLGEVVTGDQSTFPDGDSILSINVEILDGVGGSANNSGDATAPINIDVSSLDSSTEWRINYTVNTVNELECSISIFIEPFVPEIITGPSDPSGLPLPIISLLPDSVEHPVQIHEQSFVNLTTWTVTHNTGFPDPLSIEVYNGAGQRMIVGRSNITPNSFDIVFFGPRTGSVKVISKT